MKTVELKSGFTGVVVEEFTKGNKDIRPPYTLEGGFKLKGINGYIGYVTVLPKTIKETIYKGEVLFSDIQNNN